MAKQLNVSLGFTADTGEAKRQLQDLQKQLQNLASVSLGKSAGVDMFTKDLKDAQVAVAELQSKLKSATNVDTGKLDLSKFSRSLGKNTEEATKKLKQYQSALSNLGPEGDKAFISIATAIQKAEVPLRRSNKLLNEFKTTLMNTARWQISSSILHGFMGSLQSAYGYAQDLNESLNNIRIVTGQSTDEMAKFAKEANKAARQLSTTTTTYTDAALIYYQQGLSDKDVKERTDVTIKMANVARESATEVSSYMTAIWNNFDKEGTQSLEHFGDVITALGAATAASTQEIAKGLEKFAAVADTIGLSYDYATSALATIVDKTRQSEDVVGTALKTIFARIQGLKLGETLDDGTSLNKYSEALAAVGISIFDSTGELKNMDSILDEMGTKWQTLSKDQQIALAQTVAGVRQYNQLVSLMDNYGAFQDNLNVAKNADGTLDEQAKIYAESWEAARDRVTAALESIFNKLLKDDFFIGILNNIEKILGFVDKLIDGFGGLRGVILIAGSALTKMFGSEIASEVNRITDNINILTGKTKKDNTAFKNKTADIISTMGIETDTSGGKALAASAKTQAGLQQELTQQAQHLSQQRREELQTLLDIQNTLSQNVIKQGEEADAAERALEAEKTKTETMLRRSKVNDSSGKVNSLTSTMQAVGKVETGTKNIVNNLNKGSKISYSSLTSQIERISTEAEVIKKTLAGTADADLLEQTLKEIDAILKSAKTTADGMLDEASIDADALKQKLQTVHNLAQSTGDATMSSIGGNKKQREALESLGEAAYNTGVQVEHAAAGVDKMNASAEGVSKEIQKGGKATADYGAQMATLADVAMTSAAVISTLAGAIDVINDPDMTGLEKFKTILGSSMALVPSVIMSFVSLQTTFGGVGAAATAMWSAIGGPIGLAIIAGVTAAIALIAFGIHQADQAYRAAELNAQEAAEQVEVLTDRYEELTNKVNAFKDTASDYSSCLEELEKMDKAASDYGAKLDEVNSKARELIETYGLYSDYFIEDGIIKFTPEALEKQQAKFQEEANKAASQMYQGQIYSTNANVTSQATNVGRGAGSFGTGTYRTVSGGGYSYQVENTRTLTADEAQLIGEVFNDLREANEGVTPTVDQLKEGLLELENGLPKDALNKLDQIITSDTIGSFGNLANSMSEAEAANRYYAEQIMGMAIQENYGDKIKDIATNENGEVDTALYNQLTSSLTAAAAAADEEKEKSLADSYKDINVSDIKNTGDLNSALSGYDDALLKKVLGENFDGSIDNDEELGLMYAQMLGYGDKDSLTYKKGNGVGTVVDAQGNKVLDGVNDEVMRREIAKQLAMQKITDEYAATNGEDNGLQNKLDALESAVSGNQGADKYGADFTNALLNSMSAQDFEKIDLSSYFGKISQSEFDKLSDISTEDALALFGLSAEQVETLGYESADSFAEAVRSGMEGWTIDDYIGTANAQGEALAESFDIDVEEFKAYRDLLNNQTDAYKDNIEGLNAVAVANKRMEKGVKDLADKWDDYNKIMSDSEASIEDVSSVLPEVNSAVQNILNLDTEEFSLLPTDFARKHWDLINDVTNGVEGAVDELRDIAGQDILLNVTGALDTSQLNEDLVALHDQLLSYDNYGEFKVGVAIDAESEADFYSACQGIIDKAGMTAEQAQTYFKSMGYDIEFNEGENTKVSKYEVPNVKIDPESGIPIVGDPEVIEIETENVVAGTSIKTITPTGSYGGGIGVKTTAPKSATAPKTEKKGSSSKKKTEKNKEAKDETDRYHEIKEALEDIGRELDRIGKKKDRAWGGGKLAAINAETQALQKQIGALKNYHSQISANLGADRANASSYGWSFDGNGNVSNYEGTLAGLINEYNAAVAAFNSSAQEDADQEALDKAKEHYEEAKKALDQYEETKDLYEDVLDQITDATYALADAQLEAIEYSIEIKLELDDNKLKLLEDIMATIGDSAARAVDNIELIEKSIDTVINQMETSKEGIKSLLDYIGLEGDIANRILNGGMTDADATHLAEILNSYGGAIDMDRVVQDLQQYQDNLLSYNEQLRNYRDQVFDTVNNAFTEYLEDFDRVNDRIAHTINLTQGYKDLISAIGKANIDVTGKLTKQLNQALQAEAEDAYRAAIAKQHFAEEAYQKALEGYNEALATGDEYAIQKWTEILESAQDELHAAQEDSQASMTEWANAIATSFQESIQQVIQDLDTALGGLTHLREQFDQAQEIDAQYLDDYEKIYELSKLTREVQKSIDETDNVAAKKALMEYQEKINAYQREGVQMSQYELDYLRAQYDLEMAKIAMEEAANAKSQVTMTKDADGNFSYVYTADDSAVEAAEQSYEDKLFSMQQLNAQYINDLQNNILTMQEEMSAKLEEIANNDLLSYEEKQMRMQEVTDYYTERIQFYNEQLTICIDNNKALYEDEWADYHAKTGYKISANEDYVDSWEETTLAILTNVESQEEYMEQLEEAINHAKEEAINACDEAMLALDEAGMTAEELGDTISNVTDEMVNDAEDAANSAEEMSDVYQDAYRDIMDAAISFTSTYASLITNIMSQNQQLIASMQQVMETAIQMANILSSTSGVSPTGGASPGSGGTPGNGAASASAIAGEAVRIVQGVHNGTIPQTSGGWVPSAQSQGYSAAAIAVAKQAFNDSKSGGGYDYCYKKALELVGYDTGGYTGDWGTTQGKLAFLHQKELVLNAEDTSNMLNIVDMVRKIANVIDINALSSMMNAGFVAASANVSDKNSLEQNVHITAEFPNATNKSEILEAFDNVINLAAQYANRK